MPCRVFLLLLVTSTLGLLANATIALEKHLATKRTNIVIIYADDLGYGDVSCYNPERGRIPTPHIDKLAAQGMRFTDAHSSSAVCSPSRYTLLTGRYHWRTRLQQGIVGLWGKPLIAPDRLTIASMLKLSGYKTACIGKWHLGWEWPIEAGKRKLFLGKIQAQEPTPEHLTAWQHTFSQPIAEGPTTRGFDEYFGTDVPNWPPYCFIDQDRTVGSPNQWLPARLFENFQASQQGPALADWKLEPILPSIGDHACKFINVMSREQQPFFLYVPLTAPHTPLSVNKEWQGKSGLNTYADFVMETDAVVGRMLNAIDQSGTADSTMVFFTSDNGFAPYVGAQFLEEKGHFPSGPLRGYKSDVWEGGHRVPMIVRWPGQVEAGTVSHQLVHQADFLATCAAVVGTELPASAGEDSISLVPLLKGNDAAVRQHAISQSSQGLHCIRQGDWKLIFGSKSGGWSKGKETEPMQLYNLEDDLGETTNLSMKYPEKVAELTGLMTQLVDAGRSTQGPSQKNDVSVNWKRFIKASTRP
jgi:arylsulfatase A-like enzyme